MRVIFHTEFTDITNPQDDRITELQYWCTQFHESNLTPLFKGSSLGNLSFRIKEDETSFIITASEMRIKDNPTEDMFVTVHSCDPLKNTVRASGTRTPSSESPLHFAIYRARRDVGAVFHGHSPLLLSRGAVLGVPVTPKEEEPGSAALVKSVLDILDDAPFLIMKNHGFLSLGRDMKDAGEQAVKLYEQCSHQP
jgi:L-fuculose-phosphate aldolase